MRVKTRFNLIFKDESLFGDWYITLLIPGDKTEDEVRNVIDYWAEVVSRNEESYSPVTIMDMICENNDGWEWTDWDYDAIEIKDWR